MCTEETSLLRLQETSIQGRARSPSKVLTMFPMTEEYRVRLLKMGVQFNHSSSMHMHVQPYPLARTHHLILSFSLPRSAAKGADLSVVSRC